ncbi:MAG: GFA family protein [Candidatus Moraniibacteriota bacterium]|nr:MAG: GFA family protein [Candidatus Moranbacteria bacterium]
MKKYTGGCQCGVVRFEMEVEDIKEVLSCNCSRCEKAGWLLTFLPKAQFTLLSGEDNLTEYRFGDKSIAHLFCKTCGIESFAYGLGTDGVETVAINVRCVDNMDVDSLTVKKFDGKSL